ncbi:MAG: hypothetical protein WBX19_01645, partial [Terracidiphilus sp.]
MKIQPCKLPLILTAAVLIAFSVTATAQEKKKIATANDLPRFSYPMNQAPSAFLLADDATYNAFVATVLHDVNSVLNNYDIEDKATLRALYGFKVDAESLMGENEAALKSLQKLKDLQEKPEAKATAGMLSGPVLKARISSNAAGGPAFDTAFKSGFQANLDVLDWRLAQDTVKGLKGSFELATPSMIAGSEKESLDPAAAKSYTVDLN